MLPEFGGIELLAIAALALIVIGPKDLPVVLRKVGKFVGKMRGMAHEFRASFDELARQSELEELRKEVEAMRLSQSYDPTGLVPGAYGAQSGYDAAVAQEDHETLPGTAFEPPVPEPAAPARPKRTAKPKAATKTPAKSAKASTVTPATAPTVAKPGAAKPGATKPKTAKPRARKGTVQ